MACCSDHVTSKYGLFTMWFKSNFKLWFQILISDSITTIICTNYSLSNHGLTLCLNQAYDLVIKHKYKRLVITSLIEEQVKEQVR